jgi:hypothetical protein
MKSSLHMVSGLSGVVWCGAATGVECADEGWQQMLLAFLSNFSSSAHTCTPFPASAHTCTPLPCADISCPVLMQLPALQRCSCWRRQTLGWTQTSLCWRPSLPHLLESAAAGAPAAPQASAPWLV